jgi:hypothetical protein
MALLFFYRLFGLEIVYNIRSIGGKRVFPQPKDLIGTWAGLIVHHRGSVSVEVQIDKIQADGSLYGMYLFPDDPGEPAGEFTAELFGPWLYVTLDYGDSYEGLHFHLQILGKELPRVMYGAIPGIEKRVPNATVTVFKGKPPKPIKGAWQVFFTESL